MVTAFPNPQPATGTDATRARLLEAAGFVFAEQGFRAATVREICNRAGANIAAVNYHFRDKMGLYVEVVRASIGVESLGALKLDAMPAPQALRLFIANMVQRIVGADSPAVHLRIMSHEIAQPTEALPRIAEEAINPSYTLLRGVVARLLGVNPEDDAARLCAHCIIGQVVHFSAGKPVMGLLWPAMKRTPAQVEQIAKHIADFSLAGIRATHKSIAANSSGKRKT